MSSSTLGGAGQIGELKLKDGPVVQLNEYHRDEAPNILQ